MSDPIVFYILHGEDEYSRKAEVQRLRQSINDPAQLNISVLEGANATVLGIINGVSAMPFLAEQRMVIVQGFFEHMAGKGSKNAKDIYEQLAAGLVNLPNFACLVFHENKEVAEKNPILQLARSDPRGQEIRFDPPKDSSRWIMSQAKVVHKVEIEPEAIRALRDTVHNDLRKADAELAKLAAYVNYSRPITEADVAVMTPYVAEAVVFEMVDALGQRDGKKALSLLQSLFSQKQEPLMLLSMINRQFRMLILAREYLDQGGSSSGLATVLDIKPFMASKFANQAKQFPSLQVLEAIYKHLVQVDDDIKTSRMNDEMALQTFIAENTR